jgi:hypothetical protein
MTQGRIAQDLLNGDGKHLQQPFQIVGDALGSRKTCRDRRGQQRARSNLGVF